VHEISQFWFNHPVFYSLGPGRLVIPVTDDFFIRHDLHLMQMAVFKLRK